MFGKVSILVAVLTLGLIQTAQGQTACRTIDDVTQTVSLIRTIQNDQSARVQSETFLQLENVLARISVPTLLPVTARETMPAESRALIQYISTLREAASSARGGHTEFARQTLIESLSSGPGRSIRALNKYWDCNPEVPSSASLPNQSEPNAVSSAASNDAGDPSTKRVTSVGDGSNLRDRSLERRNSDGDYFNNDVVIGGNILSFLMMLGLAALIAGFVYLYQRRKSFRAREARRLMNQAVPVRVGKNDYQLTLVDISMNGAKLQHPGPLEGERRLEIMIGGFWHPAQIKWSNSLFAGVMFKTPLDADILTTIA